MSVTDEKCVTVTNDSSVTKSWEEDTNHAAYAALRLLVARQKGDNNAIATLTFPKIGECTAAIDTQPPMMDESSFGSICKIVFLSAKINYFDHYEVAK